MKYVNMLIIPTVEHRSSICIREFTIGQRERERQSKNESTNSTTNKH